MPRRRSPIRANAGFRQRIRWWSAIALLRSIASSPAAAAATLRSRASSADTTSVEDADEVGRRAVMDLDVDESTEGSDVAPGADLTEELTGGAARRRLLDMARDAEKLHGEKDTKLTKAVDLVKRLVNDGFRPIVFCRFIPTAEYLAEELRSRMGRGWEIASVTGLLPPEPRGPRGRLGQPSQAGARRNRLPQRGREPAEHFDAIVHYDLPWNPTRLEQPRRPRGPLRPEPTRGPGRNLLRDRQRHRRQGSRHPCCASTVPSANAPWHLRTGSR